MRKEVYFKTEYQISGNKPIYLTVVIGQGQPGSSSVTLNDDAVADGIITNQLIGNGSDIIRKVLHAITIVNDYQINTNNTTVKYFLSGGLEEKIYTLNATVDVDGDTVTYNFNLTFIEWGDGYE